MNPPQTDRSSLLQVPLFSASAFLIIVRLTQLKKEKQTEYKNRWTEEQKNSVTENVYKELLNETSKKLQEPIAFRLYPTLDTSMALNPQFCSDQDKAALATPYNSANDSGLRKVNEVVNYVNTQPVIQEAFRFVKGWGQLRFSMKYHCHSLKCILQHSLTQPHVLQRVQHPRFRIPPLFSEEMVKDANALLQNSKDAFMKLLGDKQIRMDLDDKINILSDKRKVRCIPS